MVPLWPSSSLLQQLFVSVLRCEVECAVLGGFAIGVGLRHISLSRGDAMSSWHVGWTAGAVLLLQAFEPSIFSFPLPYSFSTVYGCLLGAYSSGLRQRDRRHELGVDLGRGDRRSRCITVQARVWDSLLCDSGPLVAVRGFSQRSWGRIARDVLAILPGVVSCALVILWMVSIGGVEFITQENLVSWPTSYFMRTYGKMWLERNGFTVSGSAFENALSRAIPFAASFWHPTSFCGGSAPISELSCSEL